MTVAEWIAALFTLVRYHKVMVHDPDGTLRLARPPKMMLHPKTGERVVVLDAPHG